VNEAEDVDEASDGMRASDEHAQDEEHASEDTVVEDDVVDVSETELEELEVDGGCSRAYSSRASWASRRKVRRVLRYSL
jgi:hypothetical protein